MSTWFQHIFNVSPFGNAKRHRCLGEACPLKCKSPAESRRFAKHGRSLEAIASSLQPLSMFTTWRFRVIVSATCPHKLNYSDSTRIRSQFLECIFTLSFLLTVLTRWSLDGRCLGLPGKSLLRLALRLNGLCFRLAQTGCWAT